MLRARMVAAPADYRWSSHAHHALGAPYLLLTTHPALLHLGNITEERRQRYRELVMETVAPEETDAIRLHLQHQHICGPNCFCLAIEAQLGRSTGPKKIGRPRKAEVAPPAPNMPQERLL